MSPLVPRDGGDQVGFGMIRKITAAHGAGGLSVAHAVIPRGMFVPPHLHTREDEATFVVSGELRTVIGDVATGEEDVGVATAGAWILKPRGVWHAFWNEGPDDAHVIEVVTPATLDDYFAALFRLASAPFPDEHARQEAIAAHHSGHGITFDDERARVLSSRHRMSVESRR